jgi:hypothetical protein
MDDKRAEGTTILTVVHHRETPLRIVKGTVDVGPVWATEVVNARKEGLRVEAVESGERLDQRDKVNYFITKLKDASNPESADKFLDFIKSSQAQKIYMRYDFVPHFIVHKAKWVNCGHPVEAYYVILATFITSSAAFILSKPVKGVGIVMPAFVPPIIAAITVIIISKEHAPQLAYISGVMGTIIGADLLRIPQIKKLEAVF